jgi:hypothetical protein
LVESVTPPPLISVRASGQSPGNCNAGDGPISGSSGYVRIAPRTDRASYTSGWNFHAAKCATFRIEQEILTDGRRGTPDEDGLKTLLTEIRWADLKPTVTAVDRPI